MKQFFSILRFEFFNYAKNKVFLGITIAMVILIGALLSFPRISSLFEQEEQTPVSGVKRVIAVADISGGQPETVLPYLTEVYPNDQLEVTQASEESLKTGVDNGEYAAAIVIVSPLKFHYIADSVGVNDASQYVISQILQEKYRVESLQQLGVNAQKTAEIMGAQVESELILTGKNQVENFFYTYAIIFMLYMAIMLYGQFVAMSVASEKSSRAMELLITSAKPLSLMFGKVIGSGMAGLMQIVVILSSGFTFFNLNRGYWSDNEIINSLFDMPVSILFYTVLFFVLGYFIYSFFYGALGSLASRTEDINTSIMPVTFLFVIAFMIVVMSMTSGQVDSTLMVICSFIPFTSPMAMFVRIAMGNVAVWEIVVSVVILLISTILVGYLSAGIYRLGVLLYGKPPKLSEVFKMLKQKNKI